MKARPNASRLMRRRLRLQYLECREVLSGFHNVPPVVPTMHGIESPAIIGTAPIPRLSPPAQRAPAQETLVITIIVTTISAAPTQPEHASAARPAAKQEARSPEIPANAVVRTQITTRAQAVAPDAAQLFLTAEPALAELRAASNANETVPVFHGTQADAIALPPATQRDVRVVDFQLPALPTAANLVVPPRIALLAHDNGESLPFVPKTNLGSTGGGLQTLIAQPNTIIAPAAAVTVTPAPERAGLVTAVPLGRSALQQIVRSFSADKSESVPFRWNFCHWLAASTAALAVIVMHESTRRLRKPVACRISRRWMDELS